MSKKCEVKIVNNPETGRLEITLNNHKFKDLGQPTMTCPDCNIEVSREIAEQLTNHGKKS